MRAAFPVPNYESGVCRWGCSAASAAEEEQRRREEGSDGSAEEAEVRAGELPGPPRLSGNGLAARRAGRGAPCCLRLRATRGPRPAPPPRHLGSGGRRGLFGSSRAGGARSAGPQVPGLRACGLAGRARQRVWPMLPAAAPRSPPALPGAARAGAGLGLGARGPLREPGAGACTFCGESGVKA